MTVCREIGSLLAAHAFGALEPDEQRRVEAHLAGCPGCREAYEQLAELPRLLDLAGGTETPIQAPPPLLEASVLASLPRHRRPRLRPRRGPGVRPRRPRTILVSTVAVALLLTVILLPQALIGPPDQSTRLILTASPLNPGARADVQLRSHPWGTEVDLHADGLAPTRGTQIYEVWFVASRGRVSAGTFTVGPRKRVTVSLAAAAHESQYSSLGVTLEPDGFNPARRGPNILRASLRLR